MLFITVMTAIRRPAGLSPSQAALAVVSGTTPPPHTHRGRSLPTVPQPPGDRQRPPPPTGDRGQRKKPIQKHSSLGPRISRSLGEKKQCSYEVNFRCSGTDEGRGDELVPKEKDQTHSEPGGPPWDLPGRWKNPEGRAAGWTQAGRLPTG